MNIVVHQQALQICAEALELEVAEQPEFIASRANGNIELQSLAQELLARITRGSAMIPTGGARHNAAVDRTGTVLGGYRLERLLGVGGMGAVYLGQRDDQSVVHQVAIKVMNRATPNTSEMARFSMEQRALAKLHHPYVAAFIDLGEASDGTQYFVMEYIPGIAIHQYCDEQRLPLTQRIQLWLKVSDAVQSAHRNLIVHRDIKPANILVTQDGLPKLLDFGVAKLLGAESSQETTRFARHLTLDYASPERILRNELSTAEDTYALGVLLYELLIGKRPFHRSDRTFEDLVKNVEHELAPTLATTLSSFAPEEQNKIAEQRSTSWRRLNQDIYTDIQPIIAKALHADPAQRYRSVEQFVEDINRYLQARPVSARGDSTWYRLRRFISRNRLALAASSITALALLTATGISLHQANLATAQAQRATAVSEFMKQLLAAPNARWDSEWRANPDLHVSDLLQVASQQLERQLQDQPEVRIDLYGSLARSFQALDRDEDARAQMANALKIVEKEIPQDSILHATIRHDMAMMLDYTREESNLDQARQLLRDAMNWLDQHQPGPSFVRAMLTGETGHNHHMRGEYDDALRQYKQAEKVFFAAGGPPDHPLVALGYGLMGAAHMDRMDFDAAIKPFDDAIAIYERMPKVAITDASLPYGGRAMIHLVRGEFAHAVRLSEKVIEITNNSDGAQSLGRAGFHLNVAHVMCAANKLDRCDQLLQIAGQILSQIQHVPEAMQAQQRLVQAELALRRNEPLAALELLESIEPVTRINAVRGLAGVDAQGRWYLAMGQALNALQRGEEAKRHLAKATERIRQVWGDKAPFYHELSNHQPWPGAAPDQRQNLPLRTPLTST